MATMMMLLYALLFVCVAAAVSCNTRRMTYVLASNVRNARRCNYAYARNERRLYSMAKRAVVLLQQGNATLAAKMLRPDKVERPKSAASNPYAKKIDLGRLFKADHKGVFGKTLAGNTAHYDMRLWKYGFLADVAEWKIGSAPLTERNDGMRMLHHMLNCNPALAWMKDDKAIALFVVVALYTGVG